MGVRETRQSRRRAYVVALLLLLLLVVVVTVIAIWPAPNVPEIESSASASDATPATAKPLAIRKRVRRRRSEATTTPDDQPEPLAVASPPTDSRPPDPVIVKDAFSGAPLAHFKVRIIGLDRPLDEPIMSTDAAGRLLLPPAGLRAVHPVDDDNWATSNVLIGASRLSGVIWMHAWQTVTLHVSCDVAGAIPHQVGDLKRGWQKPDNESETAPGVAAVAARRGLTSSPMRGRLRVESATGRVEFDVPRIPGQFVVPDDDRWCKRRVAIPVADRAGGAVEMRLHLAEPVVLAGVIRNVATGKPVYWPRLQAYAVQRDGTTVHINPVRPGTPRFLRAGEFSFSFDPTVTSSVVLAAAGEDEHRPLRRQFDLSAGDNRHIELRLEAAPNHSAITWKRDGKELTGSDLYIRESTDPIGVTHRIRTSSLGSATARLFESGRTYLVFDADSEEHPHEFTYDGQTEIDIPKQP